MVALWVALLTRLWHSAGVLGAAGLEPGEHLREHSLRPCQLCSHSLVRVAPRQDIGDIISLFRD